MSRHTVPASTRVVDPVHSPALALDDPEEALLRALWATRPEETR